MTLFHPLGSGASGSTGTTSSRAAYLARAVEFRRQDPDTVLQLVQEDVDLGFAEWLPGGLAEALGPGSVPPVQQGGSALSKRKALPHVWWVIAPCPGANLLCRIGERIEMPSLQDVSEFLSRDPEALWTGFIMDISESGSGGLWFLSCRDH